MLWTAYLSFWSPLFFIVMDSTFHTTLHLCFRSPYKYLYLANLHIQYGHQNGQLNFMLRTAYFRVYSPQFSLYGSQIFICIFASNLTKHINWHIQYSHQSGRFMLQTAHFPVSTVLIVWVSNLHMYLCLRSPRTPLTFAYSIWPPD